MEEREYIIERIKLLPEEGLREVADFIEFLEEKRRKMEKREEKVSYPGMVRAWHRHLRGQVDCFVVLKGALKICAYDDETQELDEIVSTGDSVQVVRIPGHYWHGFKVIGDERAYLVYFVNRLYDYENPDEERRAWNDETIVPKVINGRKDDERCNKPWDLFYPPYK